MGLKRVDDLFMLQVRLFRMAQVKWDLTAKDCTKLFRDYEINDYIKTCYEEFHVQGDEANLEDIERYLKHKGYRA
jgi:hypothetical protein